MDTWSTDTWDRAYVVILIVTAWLIPLLIITYCYLKVRWIFVTTLGGYLQSDLFSVSKIFCYTRITRASLKSQQHHSSDLASSTPSSSVRLRYHRSTSTTSKQDYPSPEPDMFEVVLYTFTVFENHPKCRIWICQLWHFPPIFDLFKLTCLVTLFDANSPNWTIFGIF